MFTGFLQASDTTAAAGTFDTLLQQGIGGLVAVLSILALMAVWRYAAKVAQRVETVTDRFLGHLEAQAERDTTEAAARVAAQMKVAEALDRVQREMSDHDADAKRRHDEVIARLDRRAS